VTTTNDIQEVVCCVFAAELLVTHATLSDSCYLLQERKQS
jgi:hypothetical protein